MSYSPWGHKESDMTGAMECTHRVYLVQLLYFILKLTGWDPER